MIAVNGASPLHPEPILQVKDLAMAERTSTRAGSRRATPQPAPQDASVGIQSPPRQTTRTTRSQSRDISDTEGKRGGTKARKGAKQATPDATNNGIGKSGPQNQKGRSANRARIQQGNAICLT